MMRNPLIFFNFQVKDMTEAAPAAQRVKILLTFQTQKGTVNPNSESILDVAMVSIDAQ